MTDKLSAKEQKILSDFISEQKQKAPVISEKIVPLITGIIMFAGAAIFGASAVSIMQGMTGGSLTPYSIPGLITGIGVILFGSVLQKYLNLQFQRKKVVQVLERIMDS